MIRHLISSWDRLAETDPLWAILTSDDKAGAKWNEDEFFATGVADVELVLGRLAEFRVPVSRDRALDFGCGVGRLTRALAPRFDAVDGVDVSGAMIEKAGRIRPVPPNVRFIHNPRPDLAALQAGSYSFILSLISLQHVPETIALAYVRDMCRLLAPAGVGYVQVITFLDTADPAARDKLARDESRSNRAYRSVASLLRRKPPRMETFYCRLSRIASVLEKQRVKLVAVLPDASVPSPFVSHVLVFRKPER